MTNTKRCRVLLLGALCLALVQPTFAQTPTQTASALPRLVRFGGTAKDAGGAPLSGVAGITFALYAEQTGGAPLWQETQNVTADSSGHYTALLGATKSEGLPAELFTSEQAHWVGVQVQGQPEQPRVLLVSAPYALKAGDAETIGGLPPSAFVLAAPAAVAAGDASGVKPDAQPDSSPATACAKVTSDGTATANEVAKFTAACKIEPSNIVESGGLVGIGTSAPSATLDVNGATMLGGATTWPATGTATASKGYNSEPLDLVASVYNLGSSAAVAQTFQLQAEPVENDNTAASGALSLLYGSGASAPTETGFSIASNGKINFAPGQAFPGAGTITGVAAGSGLTGGGSSGSVTLGLLTSCASGQVLQWNGSAWACAAVGGTGTITGVTAGSGLTGGGTSGNVTLGLLTSCASGQVLQWTGSAWACAAPFATLGSNTFIGNQSVTGSVTASGTVQGSVVNSTTTLDIGGATVIQAPSGTSGNFSAGLGALPPATTGTDNTAVGDSALSANTTGVENTATGYRALGLNTTGVQNTAYGYQALYSNTYGGYNTATGEASLYSNIGGTTNTAMGMGTLYSNTNGSQNTASGYQALLSNTTGDNNTGVGFNALASNTTGGNNTAVGYETGQPLGSGNLSNTTTIGACSTVTENNALILGSTGNCSGIPAVNVGIGTPAPMYTLDVHGTGNFTGAVTFASGQTFPGAIASVSGTSPITATTSNGAVTVGLASTSACTSGSALIALPSTCSPFATLGSNTFTGNQSVTGNVTVSAAVQAGVVNALNDVTANGVVQGPVVNATTSFDIGGVPVIPAFGVGSNNFSAGLAALPNTASGGENTALGDSALAADSSGYGNTASGYQALYVNTTGYDNTATGLYALANNAGSGTPANEGISNTATGTVALLKNSTGNYNAGHGSGALYSNLGGSYNTASGANALYATTNSNNTATGYSALGSNTVGQGNTAAGVYALTNSASDTGIASTGSYNTAIGYYAGQTPYPYGLGGSNNTAVGAGVMFGYGAGSNVTISNATAIGSNAVATASNTLILGCIAGSNNCGGTVNVGIGTSTPDMALSVMGSADKTGGGSWLTYSDGRLKTVNGDFHPGLSQVLQIHPVRYSYKPGNGMGIRDFEEHIGVVAQELQRVIPEAVTENGKGYLVVNNDPIIWAMVNAIQEQQREIDSVRQGARVGSGQVEAVKYQAPDSALLDQLRKQDATIAAQQEQIRSLVDRLAKVEAAFEATAATAGSR